MISAYLLDDHELVRRGLRELLEGTGEVRVVGESGRAAVAETEIRDLAPDVAILDVRLPDGSGVEVCRHVRSADPSIRCLMLTSFDDDEALFASVLAGADGYVMKDIAGAALLLAVTCVAAGEKILDLDVAQRVLAHPPAGPDRARLEDLGLSTQELRVLSLIAEGLTNRQIAERMFLSEKTVKNYVSHVLTKLGLERRTQAALLASKLLDSC